MRHVAPLQEGDLALDKLCAECVLGAGFVSGNEMTVQKETYFACSQGGRARLYLFSCACHALAGKLGLKEVVGGR